MPIQHDPAEEVTWEVVRVTGNDSLAKRTGAKLILDETLLPMIVGVAGHAPARARGSAT